MAVLDSPAPTGLSVLEEVVGGEGVWLSEPETAISMVLPPSEEAGCCEMTTRGRSWLPPATRLPVLPLTLLGPSVVDPTEVGVAGL